ncbi:MAG: type II toxin-antitoxin system RelE/ParE family toxin [Paracoccaceae bacterium]
MKRCIFGPGVLKVLQALPDDVKATFGYALHIAELGGKAHAAKPLKGFGSGVLEVVEDHDGDTYRAIYVVRLATGIYVLDVFQKKSKSGIATPRQDIERIRERLKWATDLHNQLSK